MKFDGVKVSVALAKYDKAGNRIQYPTTYPPRPTSVPVQVNQNQSHYQPIITKSVSEKVSFKDIVSRDANPQLQPKTINITHKSSWLPETIRKRAVLAEALNISCLVNARKILEAEGYTNLDISYVGGMFLLISFGNASLAKQFIDKFEASWRSLFSKVFIWDGQNLVLDRIVGIKIYGVPLLLRDESTFNQIGNSFGKVLLGSDFSWGDHDASCGKVLIRVNPGPSINEEITLNWFNKSYKVWVYEDMEEWFPSNYCDIESEEDEEDDELVHQGIAVFYQNIDVIDDFQAPSIPQELRQDEPELYSNFKNIPVAKVTATANQSSSKNSVWKCSSK